MLDLRSPIPPSNISDCQHLASDCPFWQSNDLLRKANFCHKTDVPKHKHSYPTARQFLLGKSLF